MRIRHAKMEDVPRLAEIEAECFSPAEAAGPRQIRERVETFGNHFWILEDDSGGIVSFVDGPVTAEKDLTDDMYEDPSVHDEKGDWQMIFGVDTVPGKRRRGYAGMLLRKVIEDSRAEGRKGVVLAGRESLVPYYEKFGFVNEGKSESVHGGTVWYQMRINFEEEIHVFRCEKGRPGNTAGRQDREVRVYDFLDSLHIPYLRADHEEAGTMEQCRAIEGCLDVKSCKNLFLCNRQQTKFYLLMMPGDRVFKTKELSHQINSARLSFGSPEKMEELLDIQPGSMSVFGLMNDKENRVQLLVERDLLKEEYLGAHPCKNTSTLKVRTGDIFQIFLPAVHHDPVFVTLVGEEQGG